MGEIFVPTPTPPKMYRHTNLAESLSPTQGIWPTTLRYYENWLEFRDRPVVYSICKVVADEITKRDIKSLITDISQAVKWNDANENSLTPAKCMQVKARASNLFRKYGIPANLWNKKWIAVAHRLSALYAKTSIVRVPGYVLNTFVNKSNEIISFVETIPEKDQSELFYELRQKGYDGPIDFWK